MKTPTYRMNYTDGKNEYYIKREDLYPYSFGGNKARKGELFFRDIRRKGADCVVTYGSRYSNHCRIIANIAAFEEIPCYIVSPEKEERETYNSQMMGFLGARIITCSIEVVESTIEKTLEDLRTEGRNPYFIEGGGHGNIGTEAYRRVYREIREFEKEKSISFDYLFLSSGTGSTQAGLVCGSVIDGGGVRVIGISNARRNPYGKSVVAKSIEDYLEAEGARGHWDGRVEFVDDYIHKGYGSYHNGIKEIIKRIFLTDGIPLDPVYTGKAFYGMSDYIKRKDIRGRKILFIHTGGMPIFFDKFKEIFAL